MSFRITEYKAEILMTVHYLQVPEYVCRLFWDAFSLQPTQPQTVWYLINNELKGSNKTNKQTNKQTNSMV
jgi:hypothetical protein